MEFTNVIGPLPRIGSSRSQRATMMNTISKMLKETILAPNVAA